MLGNYAGCAGDDDGVPWPVGDVPPIVPFLTSFGASLGRGIAATPNAG